MRIPWRGDAFSPFSKEISAPLSCFEIQCYHDIYSTRLEKGGLATEWILLLSILHQKKIFQTRSTLTIAQMFLCNASSKVKEANWNFYEERNWHLDEDKWNRLLTIFSPFSLLIPLFAVERLSKWEIRVRAPANALTVNPWRLITEGISWCCTCLWQSPKVKGWDRNLKLAIGVIGALMTQYEHGKASYFCQWFYFDI